MPVSSGINNNPLRLRFTLCVNTEGLPSSPAMCCTLSYPDKEISPEIWCHQEHYFDHWGFCKIVYSYINGVVQEFM